MTDGDWMGGDAFASIDAKLTMFALANGVDLAKGEGYRRLEWYADGRERAIVLEATPEGRFRVGVVSWTSGADDAMHAGLHEAVLPEELSPVLEEAIEAANAL
jgi:hypothetical protein